jgi:hypothetical protein
VTSTAPDRAQAHHLASRSGPILYATGLFRQHIGQALTAAGKDLDHLTPADLGALEDFHRLTH